MKKFLVVLDINNTLISKVSKKERHLLENIKKEDIKDLYAIRNHFLLKRPNTHVFVEFLHSHDLDYAIWSTAMKHNVNDMINYLLEIGYHKYIGCLSQEDCLEGVITKKVKALKSVKNLEAAAVKFNKELCNCILIDDSEEKRYQNQNFIKINEIVLGGEDQELIRVAYELDKFINCKLNCEIKNIYKFLKKN